MKNIKILIMLAIVPIAIYFLIENSTIKNNQSLDGSYDKATNVKEVWNQPKKKKSRPIKKKLSKELMDSDLMVLLKPPSNIDLEYVWSEEYGCFDAELEEECEYNFLNAKSLEEALWMKENGYPTKSMLNLTKDPYYKSQLDELARNKYPAALTISSIEAINLGNFRESAHLALSNIAYSDKSKTYPHVLYGEALVLDDKLIAGVTQFFIAGLLGDSLANGRGIGLSPDTAFSTTALNSAHNYLGNVFGVSVPKDDRPDGGDGG